MSTAPGWLARLLGRHGDPRPDPDPGGVWGRALADCEQAARRTAALGRPPGVAGALLARAGVAGAEVDGWVRDAARRADRRWPDTELRVPADPAARAELDVLTRLVAARRAVLHRATLLTVPADPGEQAALLRGLDRAVRELESAAGADAD